MATAMADPPEEVGQQRVPHCDRPDVPGRQDHLFGHMKFRLGKDQDSLNAELGQPDRLAMHLDTWREHRRGPLTTTSSQVLAFFASDGRRKSPDIQLAMRPLSWTVGERGVPELDPFPGMMASAINTQPHGRGRVLIASGDPDERAPVDTGYLVDHRDVEVVISGIRRIRDIMSESAISELVVAELEPGRELVNDGQLEDYLRASAATVHHPTGTCRMGSDPRSVVDPQLRVRGVRNLRVIDASIMPKITSGNTMAGAYVIGEKGADHVLSA
jgi:choline dehydrogenase